MPIPPFLLGPLLTIFGWLRDLHQGRRRVRLTVHRAELQGPMMSVGAGPTISMTTDCYFITITNASRDRDIVVTHVWLETDPPVHVHDRDLPVRLAYSAPWETAVPAADVPAATTDVEWLARCQLSPDDKIIKSRPRRNVPPFGQISRG